MQLLHTWPRTVPHADLARGDGPVLGARHVLVHVAVPEVVHRAPRRAHHERTDAEDGQQLLVVVVWGWVIGEEWNGKSVVSIMPVTS